jgi:hypothetical protein
MIVFPMTPVAESIPTTVSTEIAVIALPTHHCRRPPEPRAIHPSAPNPSPSTKLKRDRPPDTVEMQAAKYAAMASRLTEDTIVEQYARFLSRDGTVVGQDTAGSG